jgi:hypothetical protein
MVMKLDEATFTCLDIDLYRKRAWILRRKKKTHERKKNKIALFSAAFHLNNTWPFGTTLDSYCAMLA